LLSTCTSPRGSVERSLALELRHGPVDVQRLNAGRVELLDYVAAVVARDGEDDRSTTRDDPLIVLDGVANDRAPCPLRRPAARD
jgi:hypothetical protein